MRELKRFLKRALVLTLTVALLSNSVDLLSFHVLAGDNNANALSVSGNDLQSSVSDSNAQNSVSSNSVTNSEQNNDFVITQPEMEYGLFPQMETSAIPMGFFTLDADGKVALKSTNEVKWIDRLDLTGAEFTKTLYSNLVEWTDNDGTDDKLILDSTFADSEAMTAVTTHTEKVDMTGVTTQAEFDVACNAAVSVAYEELLKLTPYVEAAFNSFDRDYPEVFWLTGSFAYASGATFYQDDAGDWYCEGTLYLLLKGNIEGTLFDVRSAGYQSETAIKTAIEARDNHVETLVNAAADKTPVEKLKYFNKWLTENNEYNTDLANAPANSPDSWECVNALAGNIGTKGPVCESYARAFKVLCDKTGIPCVLVDGLANNGTASEQHMWNYVQVDGNWYAVDVTWNDPTGGASGAVSGVENEDWLLVGADTVISGMKFIESHPVSNQASYTGVSFINGPVLSTGEYTESVASVTTSAGVTNGYATIEEAMEAAQDSDGSEVTLLGDVIATEQIKLSTAGSYKLDLNGYTLDMGSNYIMVNKGELTICDESQNADGSITATGIHTLMINLGATAKLISGTIVPGTSCAVNNMGTFEMTGGTIAESDSAYYGIYHSQKNLIIGGDAVINSGKSAAVLIEKGDVTITGGTVNGSSYGLLTADNFGTVSLKLSGNPIINSEDGGKDILLGTGDVITLAGILTGTDTYSLKMNDPAGTFAVGATDENGVTTYTISSADAAKFVSADSNYKVVLDTINNQLQLVSAIHDHDEITTAWEDVAKDDDGYILDGKYYLTQDVTATGIITIAGDVTLCLNGHKLDMGENYINVSEGASLTICDCSLNGAGKVTGTNHKTLQNCGTFVLESGTIENGVEVGAALVNSESGTAKIQGGKVAGIDDAYTSICTYGLLQVTGGEISSENDACIFIGNNDASVLELSGAPVMNSGEGVADIQIWHGKCVTITGALTGSEVYTVDPYDVVGVFAKGTDSYTLQNSDAEKLALLNDTTEINLDTENNQVVADYKTMDIAVQFVWVDEDDLWGYRPERVDFTLKANGVAVEKEPVVLPGSPAWTYTYVDMPIGDANGEIFYELVKDLNYDRYEYMVDGTAEEGFFVTMCYTQLHEFYFQMYGDDTVDVECVNPTCECAEILGRVSIVAPDANDCIYDGTGKEAELVLSEDNYFEDIKATVSEITYFNADGEPLAAGAVPTNVGTYEARATITLYDGQNTTVSVTYEITKAQMNDIVVTPYVGTYEPLIYGAVTNEKNAVTVAGAPTGAKVEYSIDGGATWSETVPTISEAGSLTVQVKVTCENYEDYTEVVEAEIYRYNLEDGFGGNRWYIGLDNWGVFYYTGGEVTPVMQSLDTVNHGMNLEKFVEGVDYLVSYSNNIEMAADDSANPPTVTITGIGNYKGTISETFTIQYYDGEVTPLYNGSATESTWYGDDVTISAEGYTVSESLNGTYAGSVTISGEGLNVTKTLYFKQNGTGYITDGKVIAVNIDKTGPVFDAAHGISIEDSFWNTLLNKITFGKFFKETKAVTITATDECSGVANYYYYLDTTGSDTVLTASELEELRASGKFVKDADGSFHIEDDSKYVIYAYAEDAVGNASTYICSDGVVLDTIAPVIEVTSLAEDIGTLKDTSAIFKVKANEDVTLGVCVITDYSGLSLGVSVPGECYDVWAEQEADKQTVMEDTEFGIVTILYKTTASANETKEITITGLAPNTFYEYYVIAFDAAENQTADAVLEDGEYYLKQFTTLKTIPVFETSPAITGIYGETLGEMSLEQLTSTNGVTGTWSLAEDDKGEYPIVDGTIAYTVTFTPTDTDKYATVTEQVIPDVEKKPIVATVANQTAKYNEAIPALTYTIAADALVGTDTRDALGVQLSTTAVKGSNAGTYPINGTYSSANYEVTFTNAILTIEKQDTVMTVAAGKESYAKTFGDAVFKLDGISVNSDATLQYIVEDSKDLAGSTVADSKVVTVDAQGNVIVQGTGSATITVKAPETTNYNASETTISVNVSKATTQDVTVDRSYIYVKDNSDSVKLAELIPADAGAVTYTVGTVTGNFTQTPTVADGILSYTLAAGDVGDTASVIVEVASEHYENFNIVLKLQLTDKKPVVVKPGTEVTVENGLIYGQALAELVFADAVFVDETTGNAVAGKLAWEKPDTVPNVADTTATWVFTPDNNEYVTVIGKADIVVNKAKQPEFGIVPLGAMEYFPGGAERTAVQTYGGIASGEVSITVPANNGVVELDANNGVNILCVGEVTITAVSHDPNGNYEDATATYELSITPYKLTANQMIWEEDVTGVETYDGKAKEPEIWMYMISGPLTEGTDYTVEYVNNTDAYTLSESDAGFDASKAPAVVVTGMGNYAGTVKKYFVINKAIATIKVEDGKSTYDKTFGDASFILDGITVESDAEVVYTVTDTYNTAGEAVADDKVITVSADGKVTVVGAGTAKVVVNVPETNNYLAAEQVITVSAVKATFADKTVERDYAYNKNNVDSIDLAGMLPTDCGDASYVIKGTTGDIAFVSAPAVSADGNLTYTLSKGTKGQTATITVEVTSDNYNTFTVTVELGLQYEAKVALKSGSEVSVTNSLTYGDKLSALTFAEAVFVEEGTDTVVSGKLSWEAPDSVPEVADTTAEWIFTPDNTDYAPVYGSVEITVAKAKQPKLSIVPMTGLVYGQAEAVKVETLGGTENANITITVPENNGVVTISAAGEITVLGAGTVTITAVAKDTTGNYEDATATYDLTVVPATIEADWIGWSGGFTGEDTYTGQAIAPTVSVSSGDLVLTQDKDYTVEYLNNKNAYTLTEADEGFDADVAPAVIVIGKGNYVGIVEKFFVINKAENAPNMPATTKTVANSVDKVGSISLPENWVWQDADLALTEVAETKAIAVYNAPDKGNYVNETVEVTITRLKAGIPYVSEINGDEVTVIENGWEHVRDDLAAAKDGDEVIVTMNDARVLPGDVVEEIKGMDVTVVLDMGNGVTWSINGKSITADNVKDIDMHVDLNTANIPADVVNKVTGQRYSMQISLAHNGEFGFTAYLSVGLDAKNAGYHAQLYRYQKAEKVLKFICEDIIDAEGIAELLFTRASEYTIIIDDEPYKEPVEENDGNTDNGGNNSGSTATTTPTTTPSTTTQTVTSPKTSDNSKVVESLLAMASVIVVGMLLMIKRRKGEQEK